MAFHVALVHGKAAYCHVSSGVVRQIKVSRYRLRCVMIADGWHAKHTDLIEQREL